MCVVVFSAWAFRVLYIIFTCVCEHAPDKEREYEGATPPSHTTNPQPPPTPKIITPREVSLKPGEQGAKMQVVLPDPKGQKDRALRFLPTVASPDPIVARENAALLALLHVRTVMVVVVCEWFWVGVGRFGPCRGGPTLHSTHPFHNPHVIHTPIHR